jgi:uncharacterized membrane protein
VTGNIVSTQSQQRSYAAEQIAEAVAAGALFAYAEPRRGKASAAARIAAAALLAAAFAPALVRRLLLAGAARRRVHLRTSVDVDHPVRDVFAFCRDFENFPRIVQSLHRVVDYEDGRSHWEVVSPGGEVLAWDAQVTKYVPNAVLAWKSVPRSVVDCNGLIRFAPNERGGTHLDIQIDYDPCHTGLSDAVRALFDVSRREQLEADLERANFYLAARLRAARSADSVAFVDPTDEADAATSSA